LEVAGNPVPVCEDFLFLFFSPSEASQAAGRAFWERRHQRNDADPPSSIQTMKAQQAALMEWRQPRGERYADLKTIKQPTLVVNGNDDIMVPTINSFTLSQHIPNAQLIVYPDSGHGALFQYPELFVAHTKLFLEPRSRSEVLGLEGEGDHRQKNAENANRQGRFPETIRGQRELTGGGIRDGRRMAGRSQTTRAGVPARPPGNGLHGARDTALQRCCDPARRGIGLDRDSKRSKRAIDSLITSVRGAIQVRAQHVRL